jgi:hypothetical protein
MGNYSNDEMRDANARVAQEKQSHGPKYPKQNRGPKYPPNPAKEAARKAAAGQPVSVQPAASKGGV